MATLKLTIYKNEKVEVGKEDTNLAKNIVLETSENTAEYTFDSKNYTLSLLALDINMQMYRPSEILAEIAITKNYTTGWDKINRKKFEVFKDKRVSLSSGTFEMGSDFYVHEVIPECYSESIHLKLRIFSPDKMLTLKKTSRTFVGKRLSQILGSELGKYSHPANKKVLESSIGNLKVLKLKGSYEHMFPFLVQYNESFYDLLARTANRWGEFMYYRDGKLCFGYGNSIKSISSYDKITYPSYNTDSILTGGDTSGSYHMEAVYDKTVSHTPVVESPYIVMGELGKFGGAEDKYFMRKIASFLGNDKDLVTWLTNNLVNDTISVAEAIIYKGQLNDDLNEKYFKEYQNGNPQYGKQDVTVYDDVTENKKVYNEFSELDSPFNEILYRTILEFEKTAGENIVQIDMGTTCPNVKLGDQVEVESEQLIVVGITANSTVKTETIKGKTTTTIEMKFGVTALGRKDNKGTFYPTILPSGHVRYSGPQKGVIKDEDDPTLKHRVRVLFDWQGDKDEPSPWLIFAAKGDGKPSTGRHVDGTEVLLGFIGGNVERPYVMGAIQNKAGYDSLIDVDIDTDQGHYIRLTDGSRAAGLSSFLFGAFSPALSTLSDFFPDLCFNGGKSAHLEGGFTIGDYYGIYKISGSSDQRNITISSPWGDVKMNAFTGITISAPNGDVKISGKNVTIEAGNNLKLLSGKNAGYKIFRDKQYSKNSAATIAMTAASAALNNLANKFQLIDLSFVRSVVEIVMRPVEGSLTVKSNRYLKLEAGKNACEYPKTAFNPKKRQKLIDEATAEGFNDDTDITIGVCALFKTVTEIVEGLKVFNTRYNDCVRAKRAFETNIKWLKDWSNDSSKTSCSNYKDLKEKLWTKGAKIKEKDLAFVEDLVGDKKFEATMQIKLKHIDDPKKREAQLKQGRSDARDFVLHSAQSLKSCIDKLLDYEIDTKEVSKWMSPKKYTLPKDGVDKMCEAVSRTKNEHLFIYEVPKDMKDLAALRAKKFSNLEAKLLRRAFWLNLMEAYSMIENRKAEVGVPLAPTPKVTDINAIAQRDNVMNEACWEAFVNSLDGLVLPEGLKVTKKQEKEDTEKFKDSLPSWGDMIDLSNIRGMIDEMGAYSDGKDGCILIGANDQTYELNDAKNPQLQEITKLTPKFPDEGAQEIINYLKGILKDQK